MDLFMQQGKTKTPEESFNLRKKLYAENSFLLVSVPVLMAVWLNQGTRL